MKNSIMINRDNLIIHIKWNGLSKRNVCVRAKHLIDEHQDIIEQSKGEIENENIL